jgi:hypothetical protein
MAIGSGLGASIGFAEESVYGTYVAPSRWLEFEKEELRKTKTVYQGGGLAAGRFAQLGSRRVVSTVGGTGSIDLEVSNKSYGLIIEHLLGSTATAVQQAATIAYLQAHTLGDNFGKYLTVQKGVPDLTGTVRPYTFLGGKITSATFSCEPQGSLMSTIEFDFKDSEDSTGLVAPSYAAGISPFHFGQANVKLGTYGAEASVQGIKKIECKIERPLNLERYYADGNGTPKKKAEPIMNDYVKVSGSFEVDFITKADFADRFRDDSSTSCVIEFVGPLIASTYYQTFRIKVAQVFFDEGTPTVEGPDVTTTTFSFVGQHDGTNPLVAIDYMSTDTSV